MRRDRAWDIQYKGKRERKVTGKYEIAKDTHMGKESMRHNERGKERDNDG